jgi:O-Antigen ligase
MHAGLVRGAGAPAGPLILLGSGLLAALALFAGDGSSYAALAVIGTAALLAAGAALALGFWGVLPWPELDWAGKALVLLLAAFVVWNGASVLWSITPDRSWEYFNRGSVYFAFGVLGLFLGAALPQPARSVAALLTVLVAAVIAWALLGKVVPDLFPDGARIARLRDPIGYWNGLALIAALALPLGLWLAVRTEHARVLRAAGAVLLFLATVTLLLTYSRGGVVVALAAVAVFIAICPERVEAVAALVISLPAAIAIAAWGFSEPGLVADQQPYDDRLRAGLVFGALLVLGVVAVGAAAYVLVGREARLRPRFRWRLTGARLLAGAAVSLLLVVLAASGGHPVDWVRDGAREFTNPVSTAGTEPGRLGSFSSNSRWTWWEETWTIFRDDLVGGAGAGTFAVARRPIRDNTTIALEPHNIALQFLAETGVVGFLLFGGAVAAAAFGVVFSLRRLNGTERAAAQALAIAPLAYLLHALIDYDWDFVALTGPVMLVLGVLLAAGHSSRPRRRYVLATIGTVLAALGLIFSLVSPWLASRSVTAAYEAIDRGGVDEALDDSRRARALNPLSIQPLLATAAAEEARGDERAALERYVEAVELQPENWRPWYELGQFELLTGRRERAIRHLRRARELDPLGPANDELVSMGL